MRVYDLIRELQAFNRDLIVKVRDSEGDFVEVDDVVASYSTLPIPDGPDPLLGVVIV